jgi:sugar phosphate isomerase/epimerase
VTHVKRWIELAALLGAQSVRVFAGSVPKDAVEEDARRWAVEGLKECAAHAGKQGVILGLENHGGITSAVDQLLGLVEAVGSPWLGVNLDTGNFEQRVYESLEKAAPYAVSVQVKVEVREGKGAKQPADLKRIVEILRAAGYRGYVALEYEAAEDPLAAVPRHLEALRAAIG